MKNKIIYMISVFTTLAVLFISCSLQEPDMKKSVDKPLSGGNTNFNVYVALGNSLTAGYQSAALTQIHQEKSYVKMIANQMGKGELEFVQPLLGYPGVGTYNTEGGGIIELNGFDAEGNPILEPAPLDGFNPMTPYISTEIANWPLAYNNLGIPGIVLADMDSAISADNSYSHSPFIDIVLRNRGANSLNPIDQALSFEPPNNATFVTCWIGNNDVLGYATSGGVSPSAPTDGSIFTALYGNMLLKLTAGGVDVVVANIPDVTSIPYFTTIEFQQEVAPGVMAPIFIQTAGGNRYATASDLILLTAQNVLGDVSGDYGPAGAPVGFHESAPLPTQFVLDAAEAEVAQDAVTEFNAIILSTAAGFEVPVVDVNAVLKEASSEHGLMIAGISLSSKFISGGLFSYDGVHPSDIGHAVIANEFIYTINAFYGAYIPPIDILQFMQDTQPTEANLSTMKIPSLNGVVKIMGGNID